MQGTVSRESGEVARPVGGAGSQRIRRRLAADQILVAAQGVTRLGAKQIPNGLGGVAFVDPVAEQRLADENRLRIVNRADEEIPIVGEAMLAETSESIVETAPEQEVAA